MSTALTTDAKQLINIAEPIFVSYYKDENGASPTLNELKQYLVSRTPDKLISILKGSDCTTFNAMPAKEILAVISLYIRKLRVW